MPKQQGKPKKGGLVLCRCKTRCLEFNPETGRYEGNGKKVTPKIKAVHSRDERLVALLQNGVQANDENMDRHLPPMDDISDESLLENDSVNQRKWQELITAHLDVLDEMASPVGNNDLKFVNDPAIHGPFIYEYSLEEEADGRDPSSLPNTGPHALDNTAPCNQAYLEREKTLWELGRTLESFEPTVETLVLQERVNRSQCELEMQKALQWETARGQHTSGPYFNTGKTGSIGIVISGLAR